MSEIRELRESLPLKLARIREIADNAIDSITCGY